MCGNEGAFIVGSARRGDEANASTERKRHREIELEDVADDDELGERRPGLGKHFAEDVEVAAAAQQDRAIEPGNRHLAGCSAPRVVDVELACESAYTRGQPRDAGRFAIE